jgi:hypothetical protein
LISHAFIGNTIFTLGIAIFTRATLLHHGIHYPREYSLTRLPTCFPLTCIPVIYKFHTVFIQSRIFTCFLLVLLSFSTLPPLLPREVVFRQSSLPAVDRGLDPPDVLDTEWSRVTCSRNSMSAQNAHERV